MALETREHGTYFYRKHWRGGRCISEYVGSGLVAQLSAAYDERDRDQKSKERQAAREQERVEEAADAEIDGLRELVEAYVSARLLADGYHRHHRGGWRLRRDSGERKANSADE